MEQQNKKHADYGQQVRVMTLAWMYKENKYCIYEVKTDKTQTPLKTEAFKLLDTVLNSEQGKKMIFQGQIYIIGTFFNVIMTFLIKITIC